MQRFLITLCLFNFSFAFAETEEYASVFQAKNEKNTRELQSHIQSDIEKLHSLVFSDKKTKYPVVIAKHSSEEKIKENK